MPVAGMRPAKCVDDAVNSQSMSDIRIRINVLIVIVVDEIVAERLAEYQPRNRNEQSTDNYNWDARISP